jgi:outer membrane protein
VAIAPAAQAETLTDALIAAYKHSHLLENNRALLRVADEDVAIAVAELRPIVSFSVTSTYNNSETTVFRGGGFQEITSDNLTTVAELTWQMTFWDFGRGELAVSSAKETVLATRASLVDREQEVLLAAVQAYVNVWLTQEIVSLRRNNLNLITQELRAAQDRFDVGEITRTDVAQAESRLASSRAELAAAEGDLAVAREAYKAATGAYPGSLSGLPKSPSLPGSLESAVSVALRGHPALRQAQHLVSAAEINVARAEAELRPTLKGTAGVGVEQGGVESETFRLQFSQPIYTGGQLRAYIRRATASREAQRANLHQVARQIEQNVGTAWANLDVARASLAATDEQIAAAQIAFDGAREEAKLGARTTLDVLNAEQELLDARALRLSSEANRYYGVYVVLRNMGLLTVEHLGLGIPTYDVAAYYNAVKDAPIAPKSVQGESLDRVIKAIGD